MRLTRRLSLLVLWSDGSDAGPPSHHGIVLRRGEPAEQDHLFNWSTRVSQSSGPGLEAVGEWLRDEGWRPAGDPSPPYGLLVRTDRSTLALATLDAASAHLGSGHEGLRLVEAVTAHGAQAVAFGTIEDTHT